MTTRFRDLLVLEPAGRLVLACDSIGGIGPKPADSVPSDPRTVGHFAVRVPLLEVLCAGARPIALVDALCVELDPTGRPIIEEVRALAAQAGIAPDAVTGSTEENARTVATGIGVTVIGVLADGRELPRAVAGDVVLCLGLPISAPEFTITIGHPDQVSVAEVRAVLASGLVHDAVPIGSKGVAHEVNGLAQGAGLGVHWAEDSPVHLERSGGPASCVVVTCRPDAAAAVRELLAPGRPCAVVARLA